MSNIKVTVVGEANVGKRCMLFTYKQQKFPEDYCPIIIEPYCMRVEINQIDYNILLQGWEGSEWYYLHHLAYTGTDVFILCYAVDSYSMDHIKQKWEPQLRKCCPKAKIILAGTRCDQERLITTKEGQKLAKMIKADGFIENSSKEQININETFSMAYNAVVDGHTNWFILKIISIKRKTKNIIDKFATFLYHK